MNRSAQLAAAICIGAITSSLAQTFPIPISNASFESPALSPNTFMYDPSGAAWTFSGNSGIINAPGGGFFGPAAPDGSQYAFLQTGGGPGAFSQSINFTLTGPYQLSYLVAGRPNNGGGAGGNIAYEVVLDATVIASDSTTTGQSFTGRSFSFAASLGTHTLTFEAVPAAGDDTAFVDLVAIEAVPEPASGIFVLGSVAGLLCVRAVRRKRN